MKNRTIVFLIILFACMTIENGQRMSLAQCVDPPTASNDGIPEPIEMGGSGDPGYECSACAPAVCPQRVCDFIHCDCLESPIMIDLQGNGYSLTSGRAGVVYDLKGTMDPRLYAWTSVNSDDAFLALDRNQDGQINSGIELFGNNTDQPTTEDPNGFVALKVFDDNHDDVIDSKDSVYNLLKLWVDSNHDGVTQPRELFSLAAKGVESISCDYRLSKRMDQYGNRFRYKAKISIHGEERWAWDVFLVSGD